MRQNPMDILVQIVNSNVNPNQVVYEMCRKNPQFSALINQMQQNNMTPQQFAMQYAKQNNIQIEQYVNALRKLGIKL